MLIIINITWPDKKQKTNNNSTIINKEFRSGFLWYSLKSKEQELLEMVNQLNEKLNVEVRKSSENHRKLWRVICTERQHKTHIWCSYCTRLRGKTTLGGRMNSLLKIDQNSYMDVSETAIMFPSHTSVNTPGNGGVLFKLHCVRDHCCRSEKLFTRS